VVFGSDKELRKVSGKPLLRHKELLHLPRAPSERAEMEIRRAETAAQRDDLVDALRAETEAQRAETEAQARADAEPESVRPCTELEKPRNEQGA